MYEPDTKAVFVGGPMDGRYQILHGSPPVYTFAGYVSVSALTPIPEHVQPPWSCTHHLYRIKTDPTGFPSIDDEGITRYEYVGES
jgi:hypothetical protein